MGQGHKLRWQLTVNEQMQSQDEGFSSLGEVLALWSSLMMGPQGRTGAGKPSSSVPRKYRWLPRAA